jgi:hypothetical protein
MTNWATVPTTISVSADAILNQIANSVATSANPTQSAHKAQVFVINELLDFQIRDRAGDMTPQQDSLSGVIICPVERRDSG